MPALVGDAKSRLTYDPTVALLPSGGAPPHQGFGSVATRRLPALRGGGAKLGGTLTLEVRSPKDHLFALFLSVPVRPLALPFGDFWLDLRTFFFVTAAVQNASEVTRVQLPVPNQPGLRGLPLAWQGQSGVFPLLEYTNAVVTVVD